MLAAFAIFALALEAIELIVVFIILCQEELIDKEICADSDACTAPYSPQAILLKGKA